MVQALRSNEVVSVTAGAWEGSDLAEGPLCGGRLSLAIGAPRLAALTGAALLPVFSVRDSARGYRTVIEAPIELAGARSDGGSEAAAEFLRRHGSWIRGFPDQWRGWKELRRA